MSGPIIRRYLSVSVILLSLGIASVAAKAQGGPPMITDDTGTIPTGHWEINTAFTWERNAEGALYGIPLLDVNYGLSKNAQLKIEIPWVVGHANGGRAIGGVGNTSIAIRWRFRDEREQHRIALSIYPAFEFNTSDASVRRRLVDKGPELLLPLQIQTQVGKYGINGDVGYRFKRGTNELIYGVVIGRTFKNRVDLLAEIHATGPTARLRASEVVYDLGSRIRMTRNTTLLVSAGRSLFNGRDLRFIGYLGIQTTF
ncbi:MAG TPA: hypothetical protein PLR83_01700 [Pyrinomonadaceae bacterium]|nr:hypothetical protein [Pyrinomonadaceae bacterium]